MSDGKRRDKKGRILLTGEYQDAAGRYSYKYTNSMGQRKAVYSWRLTEADVTPPGRKDSKPLREKEKEIQRLLLRGVYAEDMSVCDLVERYLATKTGVRHNTKAKLFWIKLQSDGKGYSTIHSVRSVLRPAFQIAVDDDILVKNPLGFQFAGVVENDSVTREAISWEQMRNFLKFVLDDVVYCKYYEVVYILFHTGMRISEFCGLTLKDIDLEGRTVNIDHQLQRTYDMRYVIEETKTDAGKRKISITEDVPQMFQAIIEDRDACSTMMKVIR